MIQSQPGIELDGLPHKRKPVTAPVGSFAEQLVLLVKAEMIAPPWRRAIGLFLLATTITLWTASGFLASSIFADASYSKPYFVTYINIVFFIFPLLPYALKEGSIRHGQKYQPLANDDIDKLPSSPPTQSQYSNPSTPSAANGHTHHRRTSSSTSTTHLHPTHSLTPIHLANQQLTTRATLRLAAHFSILWFIANYFNAASLQYTTVASTTILSSTSAVFTLMIGALMRVENFTYRKLAATLTCLAGVAIISRADTSPSAPSDRNDAGNFPAKTGSELALGDAMALLAAFLYGLYAVSFVRAVRVESRVRMPLFFGFVGLVTLVAFWPGMVVLHYTGVESFSLPKTGRVWIVVLLNAVSSVVADVAWAYALLFISPLVVTVGLSLTIPLSLVGEMVLQGRYEGGLYWVGAVVVVSSFVFVNYESPASPLVEGPDEGREDGRVDDGGNG